MQRIEEHAAELRGRPAERRAEIRPSDIADKQSVSGQHGVRLRIAGVAIVNDDGDRLRRVPRSFEDFEANASKFNNVAIVERE